MTLIGFLRPGGFNVYAGAQRVRLGVEDLLKFCDAKGLKVLTAYNWRYWPPMLFVEKLLKKGRIGAVLGAHVGPGLLGVGSVSKSVLS